MNDTGGCHPAEHDVHEDALSIVLRLRQVVAVLEVGSDHAPVRARYQPGAIG
jgi:hypothetical protein